MRMTERLGADMADQSEEQLRKQSELIGVLERLICEVKSGRMFGEFGVSFSAQAGKIGHYEEVRRRTFK